MVPYHNRLITRVDVSTQHSIPEKYGHQRSRDMGATLHAQIKQIFAVNRMRTAEGITKARPLTLHFFVNIIGLSLVNISMISLDTAFWCHPHSSKAFQTYLADGTMMYISGCVLLLAAVLQLKISVRLGVVSACRPSSWKVRYPPLTY